MVYLVLMFIENLLQYNYNLHLKLVIYLLYICLKFDIILLLNKQEAGDLFVLDVCGKFGIMLLSCKLQVSDVFASDVCSKFSIA